MMRSLFSGVAGLKTHQTRMDVIGNNIANVNTTAFKSQSMTFQDLLYQTTQNASAANANTGSGGINARQIGLGAKTGAISTAITQQGSAQSTNNPFDIMITGDSFFVVSNGSDNFFTRDGSFVVDGVGNLVMSSTGYTVQGWQSDADGNIIQDRVSALRIMSAENMVYPPEATSKAYASGIVDKNDTNVNSTAGKVMSLAFYDDLGYLYNAQFSIHPKGENGGDNGEFYIKLDKVINSSSKEDVTDIVGPSFGTKIHIDPQAGDDPDLTAEETMSKTFTIGFDQLKDGYEYDSTSKKIMDVSDPDNPQPVDDANLSSAYDLSGYDLDGTPTLNSDGSLTVKGWRIAEGSNLLKFDPNTGYFVSIGGGDSAVLKFADEAFSEISIDFTNMTMFNNNGTSTAGVVSGDFNGLGTGRRLGELSGVSVAKDGVITGSYDNGQTKILGQIAVAQFANAAGLEKSGDNLYVSTPNSGEFDGIGIDITSNGDYMTSGVLEMSNVDLANEFTTMITTQRGFQANSRIITVSDTLLEELTNLKR